MKTLVQETFENEFNEAHYKEFVKNLFNHFDFSKEYTLKHQFNDAERQALNDFTYFGTYEDAAKKCLDVLTVELKSSSKVERARSLQRNLIGKYLKTNLKDSALIAFYSKDNPDWRLSFVKMDYRLDENGVKVEIGTPPKRFSFLVGKTEPSHTAQKQLLPLLDDRKAPSLDEIEKSFSIEKVTKEFYTEIAKKFTELVGGERKIGSKKIVEAGQLKYPKPSDTLRKEFTVRLIGRLMFCWFLKKKKSEGGVPLIPNVILSSDAIIQYIDYYHSLLEPLFFQVLNTPVEKRNKSVRHSFWNNVPFLNGGLFEPHLYDYYEIYYESGLSKYINTLKVPDPWFLDLFKIFEIYNFTIDESTSIDIDISVDPEMLGRIFENLLAEINPQTGETARKSTGSYYTPRPIVEYMVDESLKQYLLTQLCFNNNVIPACRESFPFPLRKGGERGLFQKDSGQARMTEKPEKEYCQINNQKDIDDNLNKLLSYGDYEIDLTESEKDAIIDALDRVKIIDPACGSGAFPMGILHKMLLILQKIDPESKKWLSRKLARIDNEILRKELEKKLRTENWDYVHKLGIIQNSIYGVDIQPIAVEISKLRFFLSLIVDEKIDDKKPNRGIVPLPNLEFKFVASNSLIGLPKADAGLAESHKDIERLKGLRDAYFTSYGDEKRKIEKKFEETQKKMFEHALNWQAINSQTYKLSEWNPFSDEASSWFDPEWMFGIKSPSPLAGAGTGERGFDIVIANPPYVSVKAISSDNKFILSKEYETGQGRFNLFTLFLEKGHKLLSLNGILTFIIPEGIYSHVEYRHTRNYLLKNSEIILINLFSNKVFEAAVDTSILSIKNSTDNQRKFCIYRDLRNKVFEVSQNLFLNYPLNLFAVNLTVQTFNIVNRFINNNSFDVLENILEIQQGIIYSGQPKNKIFANFPKDKTFKKVLDGRDILRWRINWDDKIDNKYISYTGRLHRPREERLFIAKEKILLPRKSTKISCAYDDKQFYALNTAYICLLKNADYNLRYILSLLNSKFINFFYSVLFLGWQITIPALNTLPIKKIDEKYQQPFVTLVDQILKIKQKDPNADTSALERQIDKMVYELYGLSPEEIAIIENSIEK